MTYKNLTIYLTHNLFKQFVTFNVVKSYCGLPILIATYSGELIPIPPAGFPCNLPIRGISMKNLLPRFTTVQISILHVLTLDWFLP